MQHLKNTVSIQVCKFQEASEKYEREVVDPISAMNQQQESIIKELKFRLKDEENLDKLIKRIEKSEA